METKNLKMPLNKNIEKSDNEIFESDDLSKIREFWKQNIQKLEDINDSKTIEKVMKNIITVNTRICHILANENKNKIVFDFILEGTKQVEAFGLEESKKATSRDQLEGIHHICTKIINMLKNCAENYFSKPDSGSESIKETKKDNKDSLIINFNSIFDEVTDVEMEIEEERNTKPKLRVQKKNFEEPKSILKR